MFSFNNSENVNQLSAYNIRITERKFKISDILIFDVY